MQVQFPSKLQPLFQAARYKVAYGGRGSAKSWSYARALLIQAAAQPLRVLCTREVQKSIKDSVHKLLSDQIAALGLGGFYEVLETEIRGQNGSEFLFAGLASHTIESIKSYEGVDRVWVEEGQSVKKRSWDVLIPTIRKPGSEIWISFNPELETDETYQRFVLNAPPDTLLMQVNYHDNPWFSDVLEQERKHCQLTAPKDYDNIWLGKCKPAVAGAIYYDEVAAAEEQGRIRDVPYDPMLKVQVVFDLGWNDALTMILVQRGISDIRIIEYIEDSHKTLDHYSALLRNKNLNWGDLYLPHDGRHKDFKTGKSAQEIMQALGWSVKITPNMAVEDGIRMARMTFPRVYIDKGKSERLVQCLKRYQRAVNQQTHEPMGPLHNEWSHGADAFRYMAINAESMTNDAWAGGASLSYPQMGIV